MYDLIQLMGVRGLRVHPGEPIRLQSQALRGGAIDTADLRGHVVLVDFWGTWCPPCLAGMRHLKEMERKYAGRGLRIVGVLADHELEKARRLVAENGYDWSQMIWPNASPEDFIHPIAAEYAVGAFPTLWIIDRKGVLRERVDPEALEETLLRYLGEPGAGDD